MFGLFTQCQAKIYWAKQTNNIGCLWASKLSYVIVIYETLDEMCSYRSLQEKEALLLSLQLSSLIVTTKGSPNCKTPFMSMEK